ncbi:M48 family metalloprotease [Verrucomicrobiaceae bacterium N1E253]|uniref:M48 family metalloprotease n=1 Tax=Oceaniferula marina TaxID=2748318 RepID=A0A851GC95_9BACT|nr:M56 family metallopeptidase [Oceaniferula marina]NWK54799.1 M48 family metalloprotease [Oceaniferula marina]
MMEAIIQGVVSNVVFASVLAVFAWLVGRFAKRPHLSYLLWLLVLVKLVTPPVVSIPCIEPIQAAEVASDEAGRLLPMEVTALENVSVESASSLGVSSALMMVFSLVSVVVLIWTIVRAIAFHHLVIAETRPVPPKVDKMARQLASAIGLRKLPELCVTTANLSPMVWWMGKRVRVILPEAMFETMSDDQCCWVLVHELTHVKRRDHIVRWLECFAGVLFWWNPVMWWARKQLRIYEEWCCDTEVLEVMEAQPKDYAHALLSVVEKLVVPGGRPPVMASQMNSGGQLEQRINIIMNQEKIRKTSKLIRAGVFAGVAVTLPMGIVTAEGDDRKEKAAYKDAYKAPTMDVIKQRLDAAVKAGELTQEQADQKLEYYKKNQGQKGKRSGMRARYREYEQELKKKVAAGELSEEEAKEKLMHMKKRIAMASKKKDAYAAPSIEQVKRRLDAAVEAGELSQEDADLKLKHYQERLKRGQSDRLDKAPSIDEVKRAHAKAVKSGRMTQEQADARLKEFMKRQSGAE